MFIAMNLIYCLISASDLVRKSDFPMEKGCHIFILFRRFSEFYSKLPNIILCMIYVCSSSLAPSLYGGREMYEIPGRKSGNIGQKICHFYV
jgi:hypothetical protein